MFFYIFAYGSLMNLKSLVQTSPTAEIIDSVKLKGYQRKANAIHHEFTDVAMNIIPNPSSSVTGLLVKVPEVDMPALKQRETGYEMCDVTNLIVPTPTDRVYAFVAPDTDEYNGKQVSRSYLNLCLDGVPLDERELWLQETVIECDINEDE